MPLQYELKRTYFLILMKCYIRLIDEDVWYLILKKIGKLIDSLFEIYKNVYLELNTCYTVQPNLKTLKG